MTHTYTHTKKEPPTEEQNREELKEVIRVLALDETYWASLFSHRYRVGVRDRMTCLLTLLRLRESEKNRAS